MQTKKVFTLTQEEHSNFFSQHKPADILAALAKLGIRLETKAPGATEVATEIVYKHILKYKATSQAIVAVRRCGTGEQRTAFNAFSYMTSGDIEAKMAAGVLDFKNRVLKYTNGVAIQEKKTDDTLTEETKIVSPLDFMMAKVVGASTAIINNVQADIAHTNTVLAIPKPIGHYVEVDPEARLGTKKLDAVSDLAVRAFAGETTSEKIKRMASYMDAIPVTKAGPPVTSALKSTVTGTSVQYSYLKPAGSLISPHAACVRIIEARFRDSFPASGLGGRPVLSYFGVPVGATLETMIYSLTLLRESKVPNNALIISTETNPVLGAFMQTNGYPNFRCVTDSRETDYTMFAATFINKNVEKYVFHPSAIHFSGKKGSEKEEYLEKVNSLAIRFGISAEKIIFLANMSALLSGDHVHVSTIAHDAKQSTTLHDIMRKTLGWEVVAYKQEDYAASNSPSHILSQQEVNNSAARACVGIGTMTGPVVLVSPSLPYVPLITLLDTMMGALVHAQALIYGIGHYSSTTANVRLIERKVVQKIDLDSLGAYSQGAIEEFLNAAQNLGRLGKKVADPMNTKDRRRGDEYKSKISRREAAEKDKEKSDYESSSEEDEEDTSSEVVESPGAVIKTLEELESRGGNVEI